MAKEDQDVFAEKSETQSDDAKGEKKETKSQPDKLYTLPDGREVTGEQVLEEYQKLNTDYTKKSQTLSEIEKKQLTEEPKSDPVLDELKKLGVPLKDEVVTKEDLAKLEERLAYQSKLNDLEKTINGSDGKPVFNKQEVIKYMQEHPVYDPEIAYEQLNKDKLKEFEIKQYLEAKNSPSPAAEKGSLYLPKEERQDFKMKSEDEVTSLIEEELKQGE